MDGDGKILEQEQKQIDILLVEDNSADVKITLRAFEQARLQNNIFVVSDGEEALDFVYHRGKYQDKNAYPRPDLILLDINMPKLDGYGVLDTLKKDENFCLIPVVMLTSSKQEEDVVKSYKCGASSFMPKPVDFLEFVRAIDGFNFYWRVLNKIPDGKRGV